jgi:hypothetical protein
MQFNLTFNKPAAAMFFGEGATAVKLKVEGEGRVLFKPSTKEGGRDVFPLTPRTRGGVGITVDGRFAEEFLQATKMDRSTHMALEPASYKWIAGEAVEGKPSKVVPTARLWRALDETANKQEDAPARAPRKTRTPKAMDAGAAKPARGRRAATEASAKPVRGRKAAKGATAAPRKQRAPKAESAAQTA